jgi:hypothetical protein
VTRQNWIAVAFVLAALAVVNVPAVVGQYGTATVTVPAYGAAYNGAADQQAAVAQSQLDRIEAKLDKLLKMAEPEIPADNVTTKPGNVPAALAGAAQKCAQCHHADVAKEKGNGFALFTEDGKFADIQDRDRRRLVTYVKTGKMPPAPNKLADPEKAALLEVFDPPARK